MKNKHKNSTVLFDGMKQVDVWNGDEGWTIHSGDGAVKDSYFGLVPILFRAVNQRARAIANMPFALVTDNGADYDTSSDWHNKVGFLPNPADLLYFIEASMCVAGRAYFMRRNNIAGYSKQPRYLLPESVTFNADKLPAIVFTRYVDGAKKIFTDKDILYFWSKDPKVEIGPATNFPASVAAHACGVLYNVDEFAQAFFERGAIKSMLLTVQGNPPPGEKEKLEAWWKRVMTGMKNAFAAKVINADTVKPVVVGEGMKELENVTLTEEKRHDVALTFEIPYSILFSDAANRAVSEQDKRSWYDDSIVPECNFIAEKLNEQVFEPLGLRLKFLPETLDLFQEDEASRAQALAQLVPVLSDPVCEVALGILGYEIDKKEMAMLRKIWDAKAKASEAALERLKNPPPATPVQQTGQPAQPEQPRAQQNTPPVERPQKSAPLLNAAQIKDLDNWRQLALRLYRKGKGNAADFECRALPEAIAAPIRVHLHEAKSEEDIIEAFYQEPKYNDGYSALTAAINRACDLVEIESVK